MKTKCLILLIIFIVQFSATIGITSSFFIGDNSSDINYNINEDPDLITGFTIKETKLSQSIGVLLENLRNKIGLSEVDFTVMTVKESIGSFSIQNLAPVFDSNISSRTWNENTQLTNAFDLDDYFSDDNGDNLTYTATGNSTITIKISADNFVNFSQPVNWYGQEQVIFIASDGSFTAQSNTVNLTVLAIPPAGGGGGGGGAPTQPKEELPDFKPNFEVDPNFFRITIKQGESDKKTIEIKNTGDTILPLTWELGLLKRFITLSETAFSLNQGEVKTINLDISAEEYEQPDTFIGRILIQGAGVTRIVNIIVEVKAKVPLFDIEANIIEKTLKPDDEVKTNINIVNYGDLESMNLTLYYAIKDIDGKVISFNEENITMGKELSIVRSLKIPKDYSCTDYVVYTKATYQDITATSADMFKIVCEKLEAPAPQKVIIDGKPLIYVLIGLIICLLLIVMLLTKEYSKIRKFVKSALQGKKFKKEKLYDSKKGKPELFCKKCGAKLKEKKRYCSKCGTKIN